MDVNKLIKSLEEQIKRADELKKESYDCPELSGWKAKTSSLIAKARPNSTYLEEFNALYFRSSGGRVGWTKAQWAAAHQPIYIRSLEIAQGIIRSAIEDLKEFGFEEEKSEKVSISPNFYERTNLLYWLVRMYKWMTTGSKWRFIVVLGVLLGLIASLITIWQFLR